MEKNESNSKKRGRKRKTPILLHLFTDPSGEKNDGRRLTTLDPKTNQDLHTVAGAFATNFANQCEGVVYAWKIYSEIVRQGNYHTCIAAMVRSVIKHDTAEVYHFSAFYFSIGTLMEPWNVRVTRVGWEFFVDWSNPDYDLSKASGQDVLMVGYFYGSRGDAPQLLSHLTATRAEKRTSFFVPRYDFPDEEPVHLYLLFRDRYYKAFSTSVYVGKIFEGKSRQVTF